MPNAPVAVITSTSHHARWRWLAVLALGPLVCATERVGAQPTLTVNRWSELRTVTRPGMPLRVTLTPSEPPGERVREGALVAVSPTALVLRRNGGVDTLMASAIARVEHTDARSRRVWRVGVPLGAIAGGLITMLIDAGSGNPEPVQAFGMGAVLIGVPVGAMTAAALPIRPLYETPAR